MAKTLSKENTPNYNLSDLIDKYNSALKNNRVSKYNNIEFEVRFKQLRQLSQFEKIYEELIGRGFKVDFSGYLLRITTAFNKNGNDANEVFSNIRVEIDDMLHINQLCSENTLNSGVKFVSKRHIDSKYNKPYMIDDYKLRISIQNEVERMPETSDQVLNIKNQWGSSFKIFRYMYRTSLTHKDFPNIKIDLSKVRTNKAKSVYFMDSNVLTSDEIYEVEIEIININKEMDDKKKDDICSQLKNSIKFILSALQGTRFPVKYSQLDNVFKNYSKIIEKSKINNKAKKKIEKGDMVTKSGKHFIGPSSCTLQPINLVDDDSIDNICIQRDSFCVTDKADGERKLLFIDRDLFLYFINTGLEFQFTGVKLNSKLSNYKNTIIDGEYITEDKTGKQISLYAAFDIYFKNGEDIRNMPFQIKTGSIADEPSVEENQETKEEEKNHDGGKKMKNARIHALHKIIDKIQKNREDLSNSNQLNIVVKEFFYSNKGDRQSLFIANNNCLKLQEKSKYNTDGLIFTPMLLGCTKESADDHLKFSKYTWSQSFKWKPPEYNTIDFLISVEKDTFNRLKKRQKMLDGKLIQFYTVVLNVGVDKNNHGVIGSQAKLLSGDFKKNKISGEEFDKDYYRPEPFYPTNPSDPFAHLCHIQLHLHENELKMFTEENQIIDDDTIIEFRYDIDSKEKMNSWIPLRTRTDKTKEYKSKKNNFGNAYHVANSNWHSIHNPVTKEMLIGESILERENILNVDNDVYYNSSKKTKRENSQTIKLRNFHNYVKEMLICYVSKKKDGTNIIDLAVGKAGDLHKWLKYNVKGVLGIDISEDNIHNPHDGACKRYIELFSQKKLKYELNKSEMFGMFISGDTSKSIETGEFDIHSGKNEDIPSSNYILKCLMGTIKSINIKEDYLKNNYNRFVDKFDVCSIQFAVHYMFEDKKKLYNFAKNVSDMTSIGSYFIGTCYDGKKVYEMLKTINYNETSEIYKNGNKIWSIRKKYQDEYERFIENDEDSLGFKISVFQESINKEFDEYLVNFDYFEKVMSDNGFVLDTEFALNDVAFKSNEDFESIYNRSYNINKGFKHNNRKMSEEEKKISFLNKCFIFKKISNIVKSYVPDEDDEIKKKYSLGVGYPKKTKQTVILKQL